MGIGSPIESTNSRQLVARQHGHDPLAADRGSQGNDAGMVRYDLADDGGPAAEWVQAHGGEQLVSICRRADGHDSTLACDV
jgi:hypothetical protein